jgi:DNA-binding response OmpR family regulator
MKVLIFEDNSNLQTLLKYFFQKRGYEVHLASDGVDAVPLAQEHSPDLILMDIIMPGKNGIEACGDLRQAGVKVPIVFLTSKSFTEDEQFARKAGADAYLLKPFNGSQLEAIIAPLLKSP